MQQSRPLGGIFLYGLPWVWESAIKKGILSERTSESKPRDGNKPVNGGHWFERLRIACNRSYRQVIRRR